ncbi:MAG: type pilus assembly protein PilM [Solirubrobacterales bacterium]|jgi:type IV pilus assembly protein PilM|nr:type pilus assembly protein PilM [Solirubrobacterales bacterium]
MFSTKNTSSVVGLDVEAGSVAAIELRGNGSPSVVRTAIGDLPPGAVDDGEVVDAEALSVALRALFSEHKLPKQVRLGVANQRVAVRMMHLPLIEDPDELETAVRFQAQDELPMPLDQAVLDYQVVSKQTNDDGERRMDVVAVGARRDMLEGLTTAIRGAGLKPVGIDLSAFAMIRALAHEGEGGGEPETTLYCHLGDVTNLAVAHGDACLFTRISPFGLESVAGKLAERRELPLDEARRQLVVVGLGGDASAGLDELETTAARDALTDGAAKLVGELRMSLDYYGAQDAVPAVERLVLCGPGSTIPGLADHLEDALAYRVDELRPTALAGLEDHEAARLTVSYGLALEEAVA